MAQPQTNFVSGLAEVALKQLLTGTFEGQYLLIIEPYDMDEGGINSDVLVDGKGNVIKGKDGFVIKGPDYGRPMPLKPITGADGWIRAVRSEIQKISQTKVGNLLLRSIKFHNQIIFIRPIDVNLCNAFTQRKPGRSIQIEFNPETYSSGSQCTAKYLQMGGVYIESHEVLLHEMVHALRIASGKFGDLNPVGKGLSFYNNREEFNAVLVQGIYASERGKLVRSSHWHQFEIDKELNSSKNFFKTSSESFNYVEKFCQDNPGFTKGFVNIDTAFNPIKAYYECQEQVRSFSRSVTAQRRDKVMPMAFMVKEFLEKEFAKK